MIDVKFIRENAEIVRSDLKKRKDEEKLTWVDDILELDTQYRSSFQESQELRRRRNEVSELINKTKKEGGDVSNLFKEAKEIPKKLETIERDVEGKLSAMKIKCMRLPNILHESVPVGESEENNVEVELVGEKPTFTFTPKDHETLLKKNDLIDLERAAKISGSRFYFFKNELVELELALINYSKDFLKERGFTLMVPPFIMQKKPYEGVVGLEDFEDVMYNVQPDDSYLIATSEHPLTAMFMNETLQDIELPMKIAGISTCFRREAGTHDKSDKGIWRVHQFQKVEQVVFCKPEDSWKIHEELLINSKDFFSNLGIHFRVINICTGDIGTVAAKKYDLEAWIPSANKYKEIVSCSNCTEYQANRLNIKYGTSEGNKLVHTLNCTGVATTRAMVAIIEQFQQEDGSILIPKVLQKYMNKSKIGFA